MTSYQKFSQLLRPVYLRRLLFFPPAKHAQKNRVVSMPVVSDAYIFTFRAFVSRSRNANHLNDVFFGRFSEVILSQTFSALPFVCIVCSRAETSLGFIKKELFLLRYCFIVRFYKNEILEAFLVVLIFQFNKNL